MVRRLRTALLAAAMILGILGMHAFSEHCLDGGMPGMPGMSGMSGMDSSVVIAHDLHAGRHAAASLAAAPTHGVMLCSFLVLAGMVLLAGRRARAGLPVPTPSTGVPVRAVPAWCLPPATGPPPPVWRFSVVRC